MCILPELIIVGGKFNHHLSGVSLTAAVFQHSLTIWISNTRGKHRKREDTMSSMVNPFLLPCMRKLGLKERHQPHMMDDSIMQA